MTKRQTDDNIDDLGRRPDGSKQEQPGTEVISIQKDTVKAEQDGEEDSDANPSSKNSEFP